MECAVFLDRLCVSDFSHLDDIRPVHNQLLGHLVCDHVSSDDRVRRVLASYALHSLDKCLGVAVCDVQANGGDRGAALQDG
eukprot:scaffold34084_cov124-Isochrysis_galbana.AAC.2